ncbi:YbjN domain-containing protein [Verrucomicrobiaceae bacterium N1E253]|uniref:YbjN domain-containing protein n=1 Tax=Oceaniferula marina TaxID=2748318 RepID=A0A851GJ12_9BACT|nr:YbjN domain-containing protein [Oceaniferula marina]NWK57326.1 YbjN domain-containing protein [Oceaniferula marina]
MRPVSIQIQSVMDAFGQQGWQYEHLEDRDVIRTAFEAYHTQVHLHAQAFPQLNALSVVGETLMDLEVEQEPVVLELLARANKRITLGSLEYDLDRSQLMFRITNLFERDKFDPDIISSMVHAAIAEVDRITPYAAVIQQTSEDLLDDLSVERLLLRDDLIPPVPEYEDE